MAKFFALGRGLEFCKGSFCPKEKTKTNKTNALKSHGWLYRKRITIVMYLFHTINHVQCTCTCILLSCVKDIERHKSLWSFTGLTGEQERVFSRRTRMSAIKPFVPFITLSLAPGGKGVHYLYNSKLDFTSQSG